MDKTYIANENHPFLKGGVEVKIWRGKWCIIQSSCDMGQLEIISEPTERPDWYDEVKNYKEELLGMDVGGEDNDVKVYGYYDEDGRCHITRVQTTHSV